MNKKSRVAAVVAVSICVAVCFGDFAYAQDKSGVQAREHPIGPAPLGTPPVKKETETMTHATGEFEVKMTPQPSGDKAAVGKFSLDKKFQGDLEGTSKGEMLAIMTSVEGSAGYVAMEQVTGTLNGRSGTFALQHTGTMTRGAQQLSVTVVPDSGTGQLLGLSGQMTIKIEGGKHSYEFDYKLAEKQ